MAFDTEVEDPPGRLYCWPGGPSLARRATGARFGAAGVLRVSNRAATAFEKRWATLPQVILVPTALSAMGTMLFKSLEFRDTTANTKTPVANSHQDKFRVEVSRYLWNSYYAVIHKIESRGVHTASGADDSPIIPRPERVSLIFPRLGERSRAR